MTRRDLFLRLAAAGVAVTKPEVKWSIGQSWIIDPNVPTDQLYGCRLMTKEEIIEDMKIFYEP